MKGEEKNMKTAQEYEKTAKEVMLAKRLSTSEYIQEKMTEIEKTIEREASKGRFFIYTRISADSTRIDSKNFESITRELIKNLKELGYFIGSMASNLSDCSFCIFWNKEEYENSLPKPKQLFRNKSDRY